MSGSQDSDLPSRRPIGARPLPTNRRSQGMLMRRHGTKDSDDAAGPPVPLVAAEPPIDEDVLQEPAVIDSAETPIMPLPMVESPLASPRLLAVSRPSGVNSPSLFVLSPKPVMVSSPMAMTPDTPLPGQTASPGKAFRALQLHISRARNVSPGPPSPASQQWSALRQAVRAGQISRLGSPAPSDRVFPVRRIGSPATSERSFSLPRPKASVPKSSRLARFGSIDLPQPVRGAEMQEARKFETDVRDACWTSQYARNAHARQRGTADNINEAGGYFLTPTLTTSSMHLPFVGSNTSISNLSVPLTGVDTPTLGLGGRRKAPSQLQSPPMSTVTGVHLQPLFDVLSRYTQIAYQAPGLSWLARLPAETEVLAVLALPFVAAEQSHALEEQKFAVDCFDVILRTWPATDIEDIIDRLLWCCESASRAQGTLLNRLLNMIRTMTVPVGRPQQCTLSALRACFRALFALQIAISPNYDISRVISNISQGKWIIVDVDALNEELGRNPSTEMDVHAMMPLIAAQVVARMVDTEDHVQRQWCLASLQDFWPAPSSSFSDIQAGLPLFSCAGSVKDDVVAAQLATLTVVAHLTPHFWVSNSEMVAVALLGDVGTGLGKGKGKEGSVLKWGRTRSGQCIVTLELIHELRRICGDIPGIPGLDRISSSITRFAAELENQIAILIDAKRVLLANVLLCIRKVTRSLKAYEFALCSDTRHLIFEPSATWLSRISAWCYEAHIGAKATSSRMSSDGGNDASQGQLSFTNVTEEVLDEVQATFARVQEIYAACIASAKTSKGSRPLSIASTLSSQINLPPPSGRQKIDQWDDLMSHKYTVLKTISSVPAVSLLSLLVAVNGLLQQEDYSLFGRVVWNRYLDNNDHDLILPAAFLFMQFGERHSEETLTLIREDLLSSDEEMQQRTLRRLSNLLSRRSQILAQFHITDRTHRRPFKGIRQPISFVATDIGSSNYVETIEEEEGLDLTAGVVREVKKRLLEIGWVEDENEDGSETAAERLALSLVPSSLLTRLGSSPSGQPTVNNQPTSNQAGDGQQALLQRKSSASNYYAGVKRRVIFVSSVSAVLPYLGAVAVNVDPLVAGMAQEILSSSVRDDAALIGRPIMEMLSGEALGIIDAIHNLRLLFFAQSAMPPAFAHHILNHLVGFLKTISRDTERLDSYHLLATTMPLVRRIAAYVPEIALRDLKRNKVEAILLPSGYLWFPATAPTGPMFPRSLSTFPESEDGVPLDELKMLAIRTIQNLMVLQLLVKEPKDVYTFEKTAQPVLPSISAASTSHKRTLSGSTRVPWSPWITLGRSYLMVIRQLFRSLSSNLSDRAKLANLLEGVNATLLAFPEDIGIVAHSMIAYGGAVTRFRRLVANSNGFALFMPSIWNAYKSQSAHSSVRNALQHAIMFFYTVHGETFVFQAIDCLATVLGGEAAETSNSGTLLYDLFKCLDRSSAKTNDIAGLQQLFATMAEPTFSLPVDKAYSRPKAPTRTVSSDTSASKLSLPLSTKRSNEDFPMENLIRLCLTIIAHDAASARAPRFLRVLRVLSRKLYQHSTTARDLLRDGIDALGVILSKNITSRLGLAEANEVPSDAEKPILPTPAESSQFLAFRREYLHLVKEYTSAGGVPPTSSIGKTLALLRTILKDSSQAFAGEISEFIGNYAAACMKPGLLNPRETSFVLKDFSQLFQMYGDTVDCSRVLNIVEEMVAASVGASDLAFVDQVVVEWCRPALLICEAAGSEHRLWDLPLRRATVSLISTVIMSGNIEIFALLEIKQPTPSLLGGLILPLVVRMETSREQVQGSRPVQGDFRCTQWLRIIPYLLLACQLLKSAPATHNRRKLRKPSPTRGEDASPRDDVRQRLATATFAFQALKIVLLRASDDLQQAPSRIWTLIGTTLRELLEDGGTDFLFREQEGSPSPSSSRPVTPGDTHVSFDGSFLRPANFQQSPQSYSPRHSKTHVGPPRLIDFLLWTTLELVTSHSTPLMPQMRAFVQEKIQQTNALASIRDRRISRTPKRGSVFVRSRASLSPDPKASAQPRQSLLKWSPESTASPSRLTVSGYFSVEGMSPNPLRPNGSRIVHLGPVRMLTGGSLTSGGIASQHLTASSLAMATRRSIEAVRICMGYAPLDLLAEDESSDTQPFVPWTRASALARIVDESNAFIETEFYEELFAYPTTRAGSLSHP
ncbi:hypothetical protein DACRYDRAFT_100104 [Dacryopinax primogenitus]|uniref:Protein UNC80 C-terminal domain-containing protein n=1 Tax=Dacryopinax primogenitus (strain DJM 731) TaxID=1858805 RepID=M5G7F7_DACPD|nr:uncharacterized protein DACRYDRAFT_100104 [Dacryopinax primogenitus]EJU01792.1 hypothetical protein DACRYDRAFT_100104 [Dacryopinax primogenitus]